MSPFLRPSLRLLAPIACAIALTAAAQPCLVSSTLTASPLPAGGVYTSGQSVTFCFTITFWNTTNSNWFHGVAATFGPGWDPATLVPGPPPPNCSGGVGTWGWFNSVTGTATTAIGPVGPGFFFDLDNDGNPGNNFGDFCNGVVNWQFCWTINVASGVDCVDGADLSVMIETYGDSETGSWSSAGCTGDAVAASPPATSECCSADAGVGSSIDLCDQAAATDLFTLLGGTPQTGGNWTDPNGLPSSGVIDPASAPSGGYAYEVVDIGASCSSIATITVNIAPQPDAGVPTIVTLCSDGAPQDLFALLGPSADFGGTWSGPGSLNGALFDPATGTPGTYTYTLLGTAPCIDVSATVDVAVNAAPDAGVHASVSLCSSQAPTDLFLQLGGAPMPGGVWSGPGALSGSVFDPQTGVAGVYTYSVNGTAPCIDATALVTVTVEPATNAGQDALLAVCSTDGPVDLFALLGAAAQLGGSWTAPGGGPHSGMLDPGSDSTGDYDYLVQGTVPCIDDDATVSVSITTQLSAGTNANIQICDTGAPLNLFTALGGAPDPGGSWTDPNGVPCTSTFTPGLSLGGNYSYAHPAVAPCPTVSSLVTVNVVTQPDAGIGGAFDVCATDPSFQLFSLLLGTPQLAGAWTDPNGDPYAGLFVPGLSMDGAYTYEVGTGPPCGTANAVITIATEQPPNAGVGGPLDLCGIGGPYDLLPLLGGNPAPGAWTDPNNAPFSGTLDPALHPAGNYTYTVVGGVACPAASATLSVTLVVQPNAGTSAAVDLCNDGALTDLLPILQASSLNGTWTDPIGLAHSGTLDPATDPSGIYTYSVNAPPPCVPASATVTVNIVQPPPTGQAVQVTVCSTDASFDMLTSFINLPTTGNWIDPNGLPTSGLCDPSTFISGSYTYTLAATPPCIDGVHQFDLLIEIPPSAGTDGAMDLCSGGPPTPLISGLGGTPYQGGSWSFGGIAHSSNYDPTTDQPGSYLYVVNGTTACPADSAVVLVDEAPAPSAGTNSALMLCENGVAFDPFLFLGGSPEAGGEWTDANADPIATPLDPSAMTSGIYTYTVAGSPPCPDAQATLSVTIDQLPAAGMDGTLALCTNGDPLDPTGLLQGAPPGGTWIAPTGVVLSGLLDPTGATTGSYGYVVAGTGACASFADTALLQVTLLQPITTAAFVTPSTGCAPLQVTFSVAANGGVTQVTWNPGDGTPLLYGNTIAHAYTEAGTYAISITLLDTNGCTSTISLDTLVEAYDGPDIGIWTAPNVIPLDDPTFVATPIGDAAVSCTWSLDSIVIGEGSSLTWTIAPAITGYHDLCLVASDPGGCVTETCTQVLVDEVLVIHVPNAFTPNGDDLNEVFLPILIGVQPDDYALDIFDRWGTLVFGTRDPGAGWNGSPPSGGSLVQDGVYAWRIRARDAFTAERKEFLGHVTLIK
ncbi:MAG: gliding motility-associated C-terminal domain-containing protein [Flavobacteriales bacterium]|nr:gliding motility-associated C-terminal domain-containing protein [Flavobacteriales bacterium]